MGNILRSVQDVIRQANEESRCVRRRRMEMLRRLEQLRVATWEDRAELRRLERKDAVAEIAEELSREES